MYLEESITYLKLNKFLCLILYNIENCQNFAVKFMFAKVQTSKLESLASIFQALA